MKEWKVNFPNSNRVLARGVEHCNCSDAVQRKEQYDRRLEELINEHLASRRQQRIKDLVKQSMIPARWSSRTFDCFNVMAENQKAYETAYEYVQGFKVSGGRGLLLTGPVGTGKTHLAAAISLALLDKEYKIVFGTVANLLSQIRNTFDDSRERERDVFKRLTECDLLVIDDIGKERVSEWTEQTLFEIINSRYEGNKALVITSNNSLTDIRKKYPNTGEAIVSRILEMCQGIRMDGADWRKKALV